MSPWEPLIKWAVLGIAAMLGVYYFIRRVRRDLKKQLKSMEAGDEAQERQQAAHTRRRRRDLADDQQYRVRDDKAS